MAEAISLKNKYVVRLFLDNREGPEACARRACVAYCK
jgi:hypothetical protein